MEKMNMKNECGIKVLCTIIFIIVPIVAIIFLTADNIISNIACKSNENYCNEYLLCWHHQKGCETLSTEDRLQYDRDFQLHRRN